MERIQTYMGPFLISEVVRNGRLLLPWKNYGEQLSDPGSIGQGRS